MCVCVCVSLRGLKGYRNTLGRLETKGCKSWERGRVTDTQREGCNKSIIGVTSLSSGPDRFTLGLRELNFKEPQFSTVFDELLSKFLAFTPDVIPHTQSLIVPLSTAAFLQ